MTDIYLRLTALYGSLTATYVRFTDVHWLTVVYVKFTAEDWLLSRQDYAFCARQAAFYVRVIDIYKNQL